MDTHSTHPDDETLFDLIEGSLDAARVQQVETHLDGCAECAALVRAALAGSPDDVVPVEPMPADAAQRLQRAVAVGWQERLAGIAASEAAADARATTIDVPMPAGDVPSPAPLAQPVATSPRPRRGRWLVPSLAAAVLAALAGTSIWLGGQPATSPSGAGSGSASKDAAQPAPMNAPEAAAPATATGESGGAPARAEDSVGNVTGSPSAVAGAAKGAVAAVPPPDGIDEFVAPPVCVAVFSANAPLSLPERRIPQQVLVGPYGVRLICG